MKKFLVMLLVGLSGTVFAQDQFGSAGIRIGGTSTYNWRIYRAGSGDLNQSLLFANVGGTANQETIRMRFTQWGGLSLGGTNINSADMLAVNGNSRIAGNIYLPLLSGGSGQIRFTGEATDYGSIRAEPYGSGSGSRLRFTVGDNTDDYFSFFHSDHSQGAKEMMQIHRSQMWLKDSDLIIDNIDNKGLQLRQPDARRFGNVFITQDVGTGAGTGNTMLFEVGNNYGANYNQRMVFRSAGNDRMVIEHDGKVGIGTATPSKELEVNGTIRAKEILVEASPWPDYVFEKSYDLMSLEEVKAYIEEEGHLPNIPSAEEVESNGMAVGEMNVKLMEKVEELTLYTIDQQKEIKSLKEIIQSQEAFNKKLLERLESLENTINQSPE